MRPSRSWAGPSRPSESGRGSQAVGRAGIVASEPCAPRCGKLSQMQKLEALIDQRGPALPLLRGWCNDPAGNGGTPLPPSDVIRVDTLQRLQVTTRSMLETVVYETGGISIANGLIRLLGSGAGRSLQQTHEELGRPFDGSYPDVLMVGDELRSRGRRAIELSHAQRRNRGHDHRLRRRGGGSSGCWTRWGLRTG
jgi:hypothetical protein